MIVHVLCDQCQAAVAERVVYLTKWKQVALCPACHEGIDHDDIHECRRLVTDIKAELRSLVAENPEVTTKGFVDWFVANVSVPVFFPPFDSAVKEALRDRECFRGIKDGKTLRYEIVD